MLTAVHDRFETLRKQGKSVQEVAAAEPTKDFHSRFSKGVKPEQFLQIAYSGLLRHYAVR